MRIQLAAGLLVAVAVGAAFVPVSASDPTPITIPEAKPKAEKEQALPPMQPVVSAASLTAMAPPVVVVAKPDSKAAEPPPPPPPPAWRYLGSLITPRGMHGLVAVNDRQRFVREGQSVEGATVITLAQDHLILARGDARERIDLAPRQSGALKIVTAQTPPIIQGMPAAGQPGGPQTPAQIAAQRRLASRTPNEQAKFDNMMARMERIDMMERSGRMDGPVADKARAILQSGNDEEFQSFMKENMDKSGMSERQEDK
jgi:hypothetical protein